MKHHPKFRAVNQYCQQLEMNYERAELNVVSACLRSIITNGVGCGHKPSGFQDQDSNMIFSQMK